MSESWAVQASYKFGTNGQSMLNVRAEDPQVLQVYLDLLSDGEVITRLTHLGQVLEAGTALAPVTSPAAPGYQQPAPQAPVSQPAYQQNQPPTCPHGVRKFASSVGPKGPWAAYFCPLPKADPNACAPDWQKV